MNKPLTIFCMRYVRRVAGIEDNQPSFYVAAPSRAAALRAFNAANLRVTVSDFKNYGNEWPLTQRPTHGPSLAAVAEPGVVFAGPGVGYRDDDPLVRMPAVG